MQSLLAYISKYNLPIKELSSGDILFNEGEPCEKMGIVIKGELIISTITYNEKEETFNTAFDFITSILNDWEELLK